MASERRAPNHDWVVHHPTAALRIILGLYLALGILYAILTPPWQVFDEPAHYSYVRYVAATGQLPVLRPGDLSSSHLDQIRLWGLLPDIPIEELRYESYQPPLYYVLAAGVYRALAALGIAMPQGLRFFSLLLGLVSLWAGFKLVLALFVNDPLPALGAVAFSAFLPMHLAVSASVDNAVLARLFLNLFLWRLVALGSQGWSLRRALALGVLWGLAALSGLSAYLLPGVVLAALLWDILHHRRAGRRSFPWPPLGYGALMVGVASVLVLPWIWHNVQVYGPADPFGIGRHLRAVAAVAPAGIQAPSAKWLDWARQALATTFQSFWGEFGWMSVLLSPGIYAALGLASGLVIIHLATYMLDMVRGRVHVAPHTARGLVLLALWALLAVAGYVGMNLYAPSFQGRYLLPALTIWGLGCTLGLRKLFQYSPLPILALMAVSIMFLFALSIATGVFHGFGITSLAMSMVLIGLGHWLYARTPSAPLVLAYLGLALLALISLLRYIVPVLTPALA